MQNILIIGSSLSSIDVILTLQKTGYNGNIYCLSRNGYLPKPRLSTKLIELNHIPKLTQLNNISLSQLVRYFNQECTSVSAGLSWKHFFLNATRIDKNALSAALVHQEDHIQQILTSTNPYVEEIWQKLSCTAQQFIIDKMFTCYMNQRNPMPKSSAVALLGLLQDNKLHWIKEKISSIIQTNNEYLVTDCIGNEKRFGFIVNATGQSKDIASNPLYKDLLNKNMISKNFIGGLNVDCTTQNIIDADGNPIPTLFGIGPKTLGTYININSAEMLSKKAHSIACSLAKLTQL